MRGTRGGCRRSLVRVRYRARAARALLGQERRCCLLSRVNIVQVGVAVRRGRLRSRGQQEAHGVGTARAGAAAQHDVTISDAPIRLHEQLAAVARGEAAT